MLSRWFKKQSRLRHPDRKQRLLAVQALNAGVDLLLLSYDGDQYDKVMSAILQAAEGNKLKWDRIKQSAARLDKALDKVYISHLEKSSFFGAICHRNY